jgi:hypothetical protein
VGGKSFKKKKKKLGGGWGENKVPQKKKLRSGLRKGKEKKSTWDGTGIEKRILSVHHPSTLVHWWVLLHSGQILLQKPISLTRLVSVVHSSH